MRSRRGNRGSLDGSAAAKVLLASRPRDEVKTLWGDGLVHTRHRRWTRLETDLEVVRRHGWAHNDAEENLGGSAVAAPARRRG